MQCGWDRGVQMQDVSFDWIDYYREFAHVLLQYKNKRAELVQLIPLIYEKSGLDMPTLEKGLSS